MTEHEARARAKKVARLVRACEARDISAHTAARMDQEGRDALAALHDVRSPSTRTWAEVVRILTQHEAMASDGWLDEALRVFANPLPSFPAPALDEDEQAEHRDQVDREEAAEHRAELRDWQDREQYEMERS